MLSPYRKAVIAAIVAVVYAGLVAWHANSDGHGFHWVDAFPIVAAVGGAILTYLVPLSEDAPHLKTLVTGVLQGVAAVSVLFQNDGVAHNLLAVLVAALGTVTVHQVRNATAAETAGRAEPVS